MKTRSAQPTKKSAFCPYFCTLSGVIIEQYSMTEQTKYSEIKMYVKMLFMIILSVATVLTDLLYCTILCSDHKVLSKDNISKSHLKLSNLSSFVQHLHNINSIEYYIKLSYYCHY